MKDISHIREAMEEARKNKQVPDFEAFTEKHGLADAKMLAQSIRSYDPRWCDCPRETKIWVNEVLSRAAREWLEQVEAQEREEAEKKPAPQPDYPEGRELDCGHVVYYKTDVMRASLGTVCPACYDDPRWSG